MSLVDASHSVIVIIIVTHRTVTRKRNEKRRQRKPVLEFQSRSRWTVSSTCEEDRHGDCQAGSSLTRGDTRDNYREYQTRSFLCAKCAKRRDTDASIRVCTFRLSVLLLHVRKWISTVDFRVSSHGRKNIFEHSTNYKYNATVPRPLEMER